jgi:hypothetical protein
MSMVIFENDLIQLSLKKKFLHFFQTCLRKVFFVLNTKTPGPYPATGGGLFMWHFLFVTFSLDKQ